MSRRYRPIKDKGRKRKSGGQISQVAYGAQLESGGQISQVAYGAQLEGNTIQYNRATRRELERLLKRERQIN